MMSNHLCAKDQLKKIRTPVWRAGVLICRLVAASNDRPDQADFLFFLSSSTSVNSASTTSSFLLSPPPSGPPPPGCCSADCLYIASPSFIDACASVLVLAEMASPSLPV